MIGELTNHVWQSTLFAAAAGLLTVAFRKNRAQVRYWLWFSASIKFFVPWALLMSLGGHLVWAPAARKIAAEIMTPAVSFTMAQIAQPFPDTLPLARARRGTLDWVPMAMLGLWACGFAIIAVIRLRGWLRIRAAVRASTPIDIPATVEVRTCPGLLEPGVVGWLRPILLLPAGIVERLTPHQLEAVLAHELCHVRRRDNLFAGIHMIVEAIFWFHPLVWWIGARLVAERERACDEEVLSLGSQPRVYADAILNVCKMYVESPLVCVSGVTGADLKKRIEAIMTNRSVLRLNFAKKAALAVGGMAALGAPVVVGIMNAPAIRAQSQSSVQSGAAPAPKFEVASIKLSKDCGVPAGGGADSGGRKMAKKGGSGAPSPGRLNVCSTLENYIRTAYVMLANGHFPAKVQFFNAVPIEGGPAWARIKSDLYQIDAKAEGPASQEMMRGPMMQKLLEDRFKLKILRETREGPVLALAVAKGGSKLQRFKEGSCTPRTFPMPELAPGQAFCADEATGRNGQNVIFDRHGVDLDDFSTYLFVVTGRPIIDKTGITGRFDIHLEFSPDENTPGGAQILANQNRGDAGGVAVAASDPAGGPSIFTALQQQLGLKLEPAKGAREFLVIDHVERPSWN